MFQRNLTFFSNTSENKILPKEQLAFLYIISGPSGVGKTTIIDRLLHDLKNVEKVVAYTTRDIRPGEVRGKSYHYISRSEFLAKIDKNDFLEYLEFSGNYYGFGLSKNQVLEKLKSGIDLIVDMDYSQIQDLKQKITNCKAIFIIPPSLTSLRHRLNSRGEMKDVIDKRMAYAQNIIDHSYLGDHLVKNDDDKLEETLQVIKSIITTNRYLLQKTKFVSSLLSQDLKTLDSKDIEENRHFHPRLQHEYDTRFGVIPYR